MKYVIGENIKIKKANINDIHTIIKFQKEVIDKMNNKEFFTPLTKHEFIFPIKNNGIVYLLYYNNEIIGLFVLTINPEVDIIEEYKLNDNNNVGIIDSIMIKESYRGSSLQLQGMDIIENDAKKLQIKKLVATIHPDNKYSLNNFIKRKYKIINKINIHNGPRYIVIKEII